MSTEHDKLVIKALRTAIFVAWLVVLMMIANVVINATRDCPKCAECTR